MAKRSADDIQEIFKKAFEDQKGERTTGWKAEDSEQIVFKLLNAQTDKTGKEVKIPQDVSERLKASLLITPIRIVPFIADEMAKLNVAIDETTKEILTKVLDVQGFRQALVSDGILDKTPKGKRKKSITAHLK